MGQLMSDNIFLQTDEPMEFFFDKESTAGIRSIKRGYYDVF